MSKDKIKNVKLKRLSNGFIAGPMDAEEADGLLECYPGIYEVVAGKEFLGKTSKAPKAAPAASQDD